MNHLFNIALLFRLRHKFWGDLFMRWHSKQIQKAVAKIDVDVSDIKFVSNPLI